MKRPFLLILSLAAVVPAGHARADTPPSVWDRARDPAEGERWTVHVRVQRLLHPPASDEVLPPELQRDTELRLEAARTMLEEAGAARSPDVRLRFDLGIVYEELARHYQRDDLYRRVIDILAPAIDAAPDHPGATDALDALISAYSHLDRPREEMAAWRRYIGRLIDDRERVTPMMNMGEAEMRLGRLEDAIATFRSVLQLCGTLSNSSARNSTYALTLWDLAVALDRAGDPRSAVETAARAMQLQWDQPLPYAQLHTVTGWDIIHDEVNVYFVPPWEREWYYALGYSAAARDEHDVRAAAALWAQAESHWSAYIDHASAGPAESRWLPIARVRRERAHLERTSAEGRASRVPARPSKDESGHGEERL
jgi:tetratricopeptide (TPR) repeat protein